ncbi:MAG: AmmeMemoRadiSam system radical SAM enzyme [Sedimentisphaerales bacterium]|nr:AmmeMemoRadiSam system radical SAM enzyme [Sedimentisphaerales bacterium]
MAEQLHEAVLWDKLDGEDVQCKLCAFHCVIPEGRTGHCRVRKNVAGKLYSLVYDSVCSASVDPIEKKPLFHFQPGCKSFSIATMGCNFQCAFCQNWQISQAPRQRIINGQSADPEMIVQSAIDSGCSSIAYTYTEPTIFMELAADCGRLAHSRGLANVFVSNGYMSRDALELAGDFLDAINVDLKAFTEDFYHEQCQARLEPVLDTLRYIAHHSKIWLEVTTLVIPGLNDSTEELRSIAHFIADELDPSVPWHISRFHPQHERADIPATPIDTLKNAYELGKAAGLHYVYLGNVPGDDCESTYCHQCGQLLIQRTGYRLGDYNLLGGKCFSCGTAMAGVALDRTQI